MQHVLVDLK